MNSTQSPAEARLLASVLRAKRQRAAERALLIEPLEARVAPATFSGAAGVLTINLNNTSESVSFSTNGTTITATLAGGTAVDGGGLGGNVGGLGTGSAAITSAGFTSINVIDNATNNSVAFTASTVAYSQIFNITLDGAAAGNLTFTGNSSFASAFTASLANGFVASDVASILAFSNVLTINASGLDVLMAGTVTVANTTTITANVIQLDNPNNDFSTIGLQGTAAASIHDLNNLVFAATGFDFGSAAQTVSVTAVGSISQTGAITATGSNGSTLSIASATGAINLTSNNNLAANVGLALSVTGANGISFTNNPGGGTPLTLADISLETGALALVSSGNIVQRAGTAIQTDGAVSIQITATNHDVLLGSADNHIGGTITLSESTSGFLRDVTIRNTAANATVPTGTPLTIADNVRNLRLQFDNAGIALPGYTISGNLTLIAGGDIAQTGLLDVGGTSAITVSGDHAISLTNTGNVFSNAVGLNAPHSTQPIQLTSGGGIAIGNSDLGRGPLSIIAVTGNISQTGAIVQEKGAAPATYTVTAGNSINLNNASNILTGSQIFAGAGLTNVNVRNIDPTADFSDLTIPNTVNTLTVRFDNAGVALPNLGSVGTPLTSLTVTAPGIAQKTGTSINANSASFNALGFPLDLSNTGNDFTDISLFNSGRNDVKITDVDDLNFIGAILGSGRLTVVAGGSITDSGSINQTDTGAVGDVTFTSTGSITLNNNHSILGALNLTVTGTNTATIVNDAMLTLGTITTGTGTFTATSTNNSIVQDPNSVLTLGGISSFTATGGGDVTLNGTKNTFTGPVTLNGTDVSVHATGAIALAAGATTNLTVKSGGAGTHNITQTGALSSSAVATFDAGAGAINLSTGTNNFSRVAFFSTGPSVVITDMNALRIERSVVGAGTVTITTGGDFNSNGPLIQTTGTGLITIDTPSGNDINLDNSANVLLGQVNVPHSNDVRVVAKGDITFTPGSGVTGNLIPTAGGVVTLPTGLTNLTGLIISANSTTISSDVAVTSSGIDITGKVSFVGNRSLTTTTSNITFRSGLEVGGSLTFNLNNQAIQLAGGDWNQGSNPLAVNGNNVDVVIGGVSPASFNMSSGTISMPGNGDFSVVGNAAFQVGSTDGAETVTLANGTGTLNFGAVSALIVGLGATNDQLIKTGVGTVVVNSAAKFLGTGLAGASETPVLVSQTGLIAGRFQNSVDDTGAAHDFFAGSDIVAPTYDFTQLKVKAGGIAATNGSVTGFLPDGDKFTVSSSLGANAGLVISQEVDGSLAIVVRNDSAAGASKLTITASGGGDGRLPISGVMVHAPGATTITAPAADFTGVITTTGTLAALTSRDLAATGSLVITDGGATSAKTSIAAHEMGNVKIELVGALDKLKAVSATTSTQITANKFGTITITGDVKGSNPNLPGAINPGNFAASLISTTTANGSVLTSATIAGDLSSTWDLRGSVGKVTAKTSNGWTLGTEPSSIAMNGGLLTNVSSVALGSTSNFRLTSSGAVANLSFIELASSTLTANTFGTIKTTGSLATGSLGKITGTTITAMGNAGGIAIKSLSGASTFDNSTLNLLDGDATAIVVRDLVTNSFIVANDINNHGNLKSITVGAWADSDIEARTIGTLKVVGNLPGNRFGDFTTATVTLHGNNKGVALATFDAQGQVGDATFEIEHGNVTTFKVGREIGSTSVLLTDPAFGTLGTIQAGQWNSGTTVVAKTIGTVASVGAAAVVPRSPLLPGGIEGSSITAYLNAGTAPSISKIAIKGRLLNTVIGAESGIGSIVVGRDVLNSDLVADDFLANSSTVGRIGTLTVGSWNGSAVSANTLGVVKTTGFATPEDSSSSFTPGDVVNGLFLAHGATPKKPTGVDSFTVAGIFNASTLAAPSGIKSVAITGNDQNSLIVSDNILIPNAGFITSLTVGAMSGATTRAGSISTVKVIGSVPLNLLGNVANSLIAATSGITAGGGTQAIGSLSINGDFINSTVDAAANVASITILGESVSTGSSNRINAGYAVGSKLGSFTAGNINTTSTVTSNLVAQAIGSLTLKGNAARGFVGTADGAFIDILGSSSGVGLGTFTASGTVTNSLIRVNDGDVTSFTVGRMVSSDLLVGFRFVEADDITATVTAGLWTATNHKIGSFKTTAPFDAADVEDSASFVDSNVIAGILGTINITGVNPDTIKSTAFGVGFRTAAGAGAAGTVKTDGAATALTAPATNGQFNYLGLAG